VRFNKVIYFRYLPLTEKVVNDFYIKDLIQEKISVEYWDLSEIYFKGMNSPSYEISGLSIFKMQSIGEVESAIIDLVPILNNTLFISIMTLEGRITNLFLLLSKYNCTISVFGRNMFPSYEKKMSLINLFKKANLSNLVSFIKSKYLIFLKKTGRIKSYDIIFMGGSEGWKGIGKYSYEEIEKSILVKVNSDDYDRYLENVNVSSIVKHPYILFLDEYLPLHPDTQLFNIHNIKPEDYYPQLNLFFDHIEKLYNLPVVIAAHPKAELYKEINFFGGRKVLFNATAILTKFSNFVIAHDSTSINLPVSFRKNIMFITSNKIKKNIYSVHANVITFSEFLGLNYFYFDNLNEKFVLDVDIPKDRYNTYKYNFQTWSTTENLLTKDIFIKFLRE
jgi:hypothetical protein